MTIEQLRKAEPDLQIGKVESFNSQIDTTTGTLQLRKAIEAGPFRPFDILTGDGRRFRVPHREFIAVPPNAQRTFVVFGKEGEDYTVLDLLLVVGFNFKARNGQRRRAG